MAVSNESRCLCWTGICCFLLLSAVLFYHFFVHNGTNPNLRDVKLNNATKEHPKPAAKAGKQDPEVHAIELISAINSNPNFTWEAVLNPSAIGLMNLDRSIFEITNDSVDDEVIKMFQETNYVLKSALFTDLYEEHVSRLRSSTTFLPETFDAAIEWPRCAASINKIHNQGGCGSCWAVATTTLITDRICIATKGAVQREVSAQDLLECCYFCGSCNGTLDPFTPFFFWYTYGIHTTDCYPYTISTDCGYPCLPTTFLKPKGLGKCRGQKLCKQPGQQAKYVYKLASLVPVSEPGTPGRQRTLADVWFEKFRKKIHPVELLKREMMAHGPVVLCFNVFEDFLHYKKGVYNIINGTDETHIYDHCVKITGWGFDNASGKEYLRAINSWSTNWATDGTFKIDVKMLKDYRSDLYAGVPRI